MINKEIKELYKQCKEHDYRLYGNNSDLKSYIRTLLDLADQFYWNIKKHYFDGYTPHSFYIHEVNCACLAYEINPNNNSAMIEYFLNVVHRYLDDGIFDVYWIKNRTSTTHSILGTHLRFRIEDKRKRAVLDYDKEKLEKALGVLGNTWFAKSIKDQLENKA